MIRSRVTARKYMGDDRYSWAVFIDGKPMVTGLSKSEVPFYKQEAKDILARKQGASRGN